MPRRATVAPHVSVDALEERYRRARDPVARSHWHMVWLVASGHHVPTVADLVGYSPNWVRTIIRRYNTEGADGIADRRRANPGTPPLLSPVLRPDLNVALAGPAPDGGLWTSRKVAAWMAERLGRPVRGQRGWDAMRVVGYTPQRPRPRATRADPAAQAAFKKGGAAPRSRRSGAPIRRRP